MDAAFRDIYERDAAYVWSSLRRLGVAERDRADVLQEVFLVFHRKLPEIDRERPARPYLFGIAFRHALRYRALRRHAVEVSASVEELSGQPVGQHDAAETRERAELIHRAIASIELERRAVLMLADLDGHTAPEIASILELPLNTVYSRLRVARQELSAAVQALLTRERAG